MSETVVQRRLANQIRKEVSEILSFDFNHTPGAMITISLVRITRDLGLAKVYITVLPDEKLDPAVEALNENAWEIRHALAKRIRNKVKKIPELRFYQDDSFVESNRIEELLNEIKPNDEEA